MSEGQKYHCGPDSWSKKSRKVLSSILVNDACKIHDGYYGVLGRSKAKSDLVFLKDSFTWNPLSWLVAPFAYLGVVIGGSEAYELAQKAAFDRAKEEETV